MPSYLAARALCLNRKPAATREALSGTGLAGDAAALDRAVVAGMRFTASFYVRCLCLLHGRGRRYLRRSVRAVGCDHLRDALALNRGAILVAVHLGDFDIGGHWVAHEARRRLVVASDPVRPAWRDALYRMMRTRAGFDVVARGRTSLTDLSRQLAAGNLVLFLADRRPTGRTIDVPFLGRRAVFPTAIALLSARTGAPILTAVTFNRAGSRDVRIGPPRWASGPDDHRWVPAVLAELESSIRSAPTQWHVPADLGQMAVSFGGPARTEALRPIPSRRPGILQRGPDPRGPDRLGSS